MASTCGQECVSVTSAPDYAEAGGLGTSIGDREDEVLHQVTRKPEQSFCGFQVCVTLAARGPMEKV